ncbi:hypothetical protein GCM10009127_12300 [Alteraurantiacibacter aestuarii]|uniref:Tetratricopeptide repeat protein n=1 Tax=Alteraurantiacibacter aestuarii TaxID=650004 RepID=A0A844ZII8_9SPHN|nr:hypothetical protein [Alteraurantiacibacter aestuarii]MXO87615.1 hypothetical protein [Alteraurantiacibacter aestuarii]
MRIVSRLLVLAGAAALLNGCALLGIGHKGAHIEALSTLPGDAEAFVQFESGRDSLASGNYAAAIAEFSHARAEPTLLGPALNGMAVAYARLGREDLAERYFREATMADPADTRFAANLLRLQQAGQKAASQAATLAFDARYVPTPMVVRAGSGTAMLPTGGAAPRLTVTQSQQQLVRIDAAQVQLSAMVAEPSVNGMQVHLQFGWPNHLTNGGGSSRVHVGLPAGEDGPVRIAAGPAISGHVAWAWP